MTIIKYNTTTKNIIQKLISEFLKIQKYSSSLKRLSFIMKKHNKTPKTSKLKKNNNLKTEQVLIF